MKATLEDVGHFARAERGLATVALARPDGTVQVTVVNAGLMTHPTTGVQAAAFVAGGDALKLSLLRKRPLATLSWRHGWEWVSLEGTSDLIGPADFPSGFDPSALAALLRGVFVAAGGDHDNWDEYDRVMAEERRTCVFVTPLRSYGVFRM